MHERDYKLNLVLIQVLDSSPTQVAISLLVQIHNQVFTFSISVSYTFFNHSYWIFSPILDLALCTQVCWSKRFDIHLEVSERIDDPNHYVPNAMRHFNRKGRCFFFFPVFTRRFSNPCDQWIVKKRVYSKNSETIWTIIPIGMNKKSAKKLAPSDDFVPPFLSTPGPA